MDDQLRWDDEEKEGVFSILESNFKDCLNYLQKYITFTLVISVIYLAILIEPQPIEAPGTPVSIKGPFASALLGAFYVAIGGMATYVAKRANNIASVLYRYKPTRFEALRLSPSIGTTDILVVRFLVSFVPPAILGLHLGYVGYKASNGGVAIPIIVYFAVGVTLWLELPVGKRVIKKHADESKTS